MEEWAFLFDLLFSYLKQCHETWNVLQKLKGRPNYLESARQFVDLVAPALHRYAVHFRRLSLKQQERDGQNFMLRRWLSETSSKLEEYQVPINQLSLVKVKSGVRLWLKPHSQSSLTRLEAQRVLYRQAFLSGPAKRARVNKVSVTDLPLLVPDLPQAVDACEPQVLLDSSQVIFEPFTFPL